MLVRKLVEQVVVHVDETFTVEFKSGTIILMSVLRTAPKSEEGAYAKYIKKMITLLKNGAIY